MSNYLSVFRSNFGEAQILEAYNSILAKWPVDYEEIYIPTRLGRTHVITCGPKEAPPMVLIHAFCAGAVSWYQNVKSLSENHRLYVVDIIGDPNKSQPVKLIRLLSDYIDWFKELMGGLQIEKADFVGNSVGAFHIMNFALVAPQYVRRMVLIGPAATFRKITPFYLHTFPGGMTGWTFLVRHAVRWIENGSSLDPLFHRFFYLVLKYGKSANQVFPSVFNDEQLKQIAIPTLLIYGEKEVIYNYNLAIERAEKLMQNIKVVIISEANHITATSRPHLTNMAICDFLKTDN